MNAASQSEDEVFADAVQVFSQAARRRDKHGEQLDFAGFLGQVLAAVAANWGGPDRLLAGRSSSWEAGYVESLLEGTMGEEPDDWLSFRTEPVVVPLNVAELIESGDWHLGLLALDSAIVTVDPKHASVESDDALRAWEAQVVEVTTRYTTEYRRYADQFSMAVRAAAAHIDGLSVDVAITVNSDPTSDWWADRAVNNPSGYGGDELTFELWSAAHDTVALPNVDIRFDEPTSHDRAGDQP